MRTPQQIKERCDGCRRWFEPAPSKRKIQHYCSRKRCQRERHRLACQAYHRANPEEDKSRRPKIRAWTRKMDYWASWRRDHRAYRLRDNARRRAAYRRRLLSAKRDARKRVSLEKLKSIQGMGVDFSAKRDARDRRVDEILSYLVWKEIPQNETHTQTVPLTL
jgi:hypothetical protein